MVNGNLRFFWRVSLHVRLSISHPESIPYYMRTISADTTLGIQEEAKDPIVLQLPSRRGVLQLPSRRRWGTFYLSYSFGTTSGGQFRPGNVPEVELN
jgi:hypothetical protein